MASFPPPVTPMSKVELSVTCKNLRDCDVMSKSDPVCILYAKDVKSGRLHEMGRTEQIMDTLNPQWTTGFKMDYRFEERQVLQFHVFDWDSKSTDSKDQDKLGWVELSLAEVMANGAGPLTRNLTSGKGGTISIVGEEVTESREVVTLSLAGSSLDKKDFFGKSDPFLIFSRAVGHQEQYNAVHKTEHVMNTLDPVWKTFQISASALCGGDHHRVLKIECFDWDSDGGHDLIGEIFTTLADIKTGAQSFSFINPKKKKKSSYKDSGKLVVRSCVIHEEPTFLDFIKEGLQMHFTVAVDFTASNGDPRDPSSNHAFSATGENEYSQAIRAVGEIIQDYDSDKQFPALGFGGRVPPTMEVSHEFFLNGSPDNPYCAGVQGVLDAYRNALCRVGLYGPTNFSPVINHVANFARANCDGKNYFVLLIITDGAITDLAATIDAIVKASALPMSIIIVGVGSADFDSMDMLDGDKKKLQSKGHVAARDIVQFVERRRFGEASDSGYQRAALAASVLSELPGQVKAYMKALKEKA